MNEGSNGPERNEQATPPSIGITSKVESSRDIGRPSGASSENRNLSHLGTFEAVKEELGINQSEDGLYRNSDGRIVVFRAQHNKYPEELIAKTSRYAGGIYGLGAYFGNSPEAVALYARLNNQDIQAYLLPEIDEDNIAYMSRRQARLHRYDETTSQLKVFSVGSDKPHLQRRITHVQPEKSGKQLWVVIPASAQDKINEVEKFAFLGRVGADAPRFSKVRKAARRVFYEKPRSNSTPEEKEATIRNFEDFEYHSDSNDLQFNRDDLDQVFEDYSPAKLIEFFKTEFAEEFKDYTGIEEGYNVEKHTQMVLSEFDTYHSYKSFPLGMDANFFRVMIALHDIRKGQAYRKGNTYLQHEYTPPVVKRTLDKLGYSQRERDLVVALISSDPIGEVLKAPVDGKEAYLKLATKDIMEKVRELGVPAEEFFDVLLTFYLSDAGSYASHAEGYIPNPGGRPKVDKLFDVDREHRTIKLKPEPQRLVDKLRENLVLAA